MFPWSVRRAGSRHVPPTGVKTSASRECSENNYKNFRKFFTTPLSISFSTSHIIDVFRTIFSRRHAHLHSYYFNRIIASGNEFAKVRIIFNFLHGWSEAPNPTGFSGYPGRRCVVCSSTEKVRQECHPARIFAGMVRFALRPAAPPRIRRRVTNATSPRIRRC